MGTSYRNEFFSVSGVVDLCAACTALHDGALARQQKVLGIVSLVCSIPIALFFLACLGMFGVWLYLCIVVKTTH